MVTNERRPSSPSEIANKPAIARCGDFVHSWLAAAAAIRGLGSRTTAHREAAILTMVEGGAPSIPRLQRALRASPLAACSAAIALSQLGIDGGIQSVLMRCYDEEWLADSSERQYLLAALRQFELDRLGSALEAGLDGAIIERELQNCFNRLTLALSALRVLVQYGKRCPFVWWERSLYFGSSALPRIRDNAFAGLAYTLAEHIRSAALSGLLEQYPEDAFTALARGLGHADVSVMRTAVSGFRRLNDRRALPLLQPVAFAPSHPLALDSRKAIERIAGNNAEPLVLVRGYYADANVALENQLVHPVESPASGPSDELLRSS